MKKCKYIILLILIFSSNVFSSFQLIDKIVAIVNNDIILESDINSLINLSIFPSSTSREEKILLRKKILNKLIQDTIILQISKNLNFNENDEELENIINNILSNEKNLKLLSDSYINFLKKEIIVRKVIFSEVSKRINISKEEMNTVKKQILLRNKNLRKFKLDHILIRLPENPTPNQVDKANIIANHLKKNLSFNRSLYYNFLKNKIYFKHFYVHWKKLEELPSLFFSSLKNAKKGDIIGPIHSSAGFHILKIIDVHENKFFSNLIHARQILLRTSILQSYEQAYLKFIQILKKIKDCELDFSDAAKQYSEDYYSYNKGGDIGWNYIELFYNNFQKFFIKLKKNEIGSPIKSIYGLHLIQLIDSCKKENSEIFFQNFAFNILFNQKFEKEKKYWIKEIKSSSYIKILDKNLI